VSAKPLVRSPFKARRAEPEIVWRYCDRLEPGEYRAYSRSAKVYRDGGFKRWVCAVQFDILSESLMEVQTRVTWYLNLGNGENPKAGRRTNYFEAWIVANGGPPKRNDRLSHRSFEHRHARVLVEDTQRNFEQVTQPEHAYSVVRKVLEWETGVSIS